MQTSGNTRGLAVCAFNLVPLTQTDPIVEKVHSRQTFMAQYTSLARHFAVRVCVAVTLAVSMLAAFEVYAFLHFHPGVNALVLATKVETVKNESPAERAYRAEFKQADKVIYHPWVLWRRQPYQGEMISIDQNGIRQTLHTRCDDRTFTIWMFGDSVMWGAGAPDPETIPSLIAANYEKAGRLVCIVNYAEKGWANTQEVIGLMEELKHAHHKPDEVLFYDGGTEAFTAYQNGLVDVHSNYLSFKSYLDNLGAYERGGFSYFSQTNTYRFLKKMGTQAQGQGKPAQSRNTELDPEAASAAIVENYVQNMEFVNLLAKQHGFRPIFAWYPNMAVGHKQLTTQEEHVLASEYRLFPGLGPMYDAVYKRARELNRPDLIYLGDMLDDQKSSLYVGISHLNSEGNQIVADRLFQILEQAPGKSLDSRGK